MEILSKHIDFPKLRILEMAGRGVGVGDEDLSWMTASYAFDSLTTLELELQSFRKPPTNSYHQTYAAFFRSLPSLRSLKVERILSTGTIESIVKRHGNSLRQLELLFRRTFGLTAGLVLGLDEVEKICQHCPGLKELSLPIACSKGDEKEVAIY
jgi:hypothetical protein